MAATISPVVFEDERDQSIFQALAVARKRALELGVDVKDRLVTIHERLDNGKTIWRINYGLKATNVRGGDLIIEIDPLDNSVHRVLRGQ